MKHANTYPVPTDPTSIMDLFSFSDGAMQEVIIQAPEANAANLYIGTKSAQPGFIKPGGSATIQADSMKNTYVVGTTGDDVIVLVVR